MFFKKAARRSIIVLNVVPLIDISAMIIIFLIMGAIFGDSSVNVPTDIILPRSDNKEQVNNAPQVSISGGKVQFNLMPNISFSESDFNIKNNSESIVLLKERIKKYIEQLPISEKSQGVLLNIVADKMTPYKLVYDVLSVFRSAGFQSILFVAEGK